MSRKFEHYESPFCTGELCAGSRFFRYNPDEALLEWQAKKDLFSKQAPYPAVDKSQVVCQLTDLDEKKRVEMQSDTNGFLDLKPLNAPLGDNATMGLNYLTYEGVHWAAGKGNDIIIELNHGGSVQLLESDGFTANLFSLRGVLVPGTADKASMRFALMDPTVKPTKMEDGAQSPQPDLPYFLRDSYGLPMRTSPAVLKTFQLDCELQK
jgi:hypothetical protein